MSLLLALSVRGALVLAIVWTLDRALRPRMKARSRRAWWTLVPVAFLLPFGFPILPVPPIFQTAFGSDINAGEAGLGFRDDGGKISGGGIFADGGAGILGGGFSLPQLIAGVWLLGAAAYLAVVIVRTVRASRRWSSLRLSTDGALLGLLEDCKADAGITAPIGIAIAENLPGPALFGWLRPRLLLPAAFVAAASRRELRAAMLHELAHFRALDIPLQWLHMLACAAHWFNPAAHLSARCWRQFCEEAADEAAIDWLGRSREGEYGEAFMTALKHGCGDGKFSFPPGALAIAESNKNLTQRMIMILNHAQKKPRALLALALMLGIAAAAILLPVSNAARAADGASEKIPDAPAIEAMKAWLAVIDAGKYAESWDGCSKSIKEQLTRTKWIEALKGARGRLGKCSARTVLMSQELAEIPVSRDKMRKGEFTVAVCETVFANDRKMTETVTFEKESDGVWRASGYVIR